MTINIYLNNVDESHGGATRFLEPINPSTEINSENTVLSKVQPLRGTAAIFHDNVLHDGEELTAGVKYLLRTDIMYSRVLPFEFERLVQKLETDKEKGETALELALGLEEAGNRDEAVRWYKKAFRLCPELDV
ncbi:hypothetical protein PVAG01_00353 [Phlyctema vagabunda]|uniref:Prolyl 4-hydroxylase alpha subunit Fe(2+) 2OG dioxygenase domain-containing protein n=1 Tax=Phlyctema vagabunda TaxID=108571 RepID=A0ABR4PU06_9HELO